MIGELNGVIKPYSVPALVQRQVLPYYLTKTLAFRSGEHILIPKDVLSYVTYRSANGKFITLVNIYAPNEDDPNFFISVFNQLLGFIVTR